MTVHQIVNSIANKDYDEDQNPHHVFIIVDKFYFRVR